MLGVFFHDARYTYNWKKQCLLTEHVHRISSCDQFEVWHGGRVLWLLWRGQRHAAHNIVGLKVHWAWPMLSLSLVCSISFDMRVCVCVHARGGCVSQLALHVTVAHAAAHVSKEEVAMVALVIVAGTSCLVCNRGAWRGSLTVWCMVGE